MKMLFDVVLFVGGVLIRLCWLLPWQYILEYLDELVEISEPLRNIALSMMKLMTSSLC